jgi:hypothetical protein
VQSIGSTVYPSSFITKKNHHNGMIMQNMGAVRIASGFKKTE